MFACMDRLGYIVTSPEHHKFLVETNSRRSSSCVLLEGAKVFESPVVS